MSSTRLITTSSNVNENRDRLSNLHESMLSHILSRLPTKEAVRTSILSKDWKHKWTFSYNVDTEFECWRTGFTFRDFLNEILISRQHLKTFRATFCIGMKNSVKTWIDAAMGYKLEVLDVHLNANPLTFPITLLNSTSLRELRLVQPHLFVKINVAEENYAPNLTSLLLYNVAFVNRNLNSSSVSFNFPVLERLEFCGTTFRYHKWMNVKSVEIYAPLLTTFLFRPALLYNTEDCCNYYSIKIVAPRLSRFSCFDRLPRNLILDGSSVVSAVLYGRYNLQRVESTGKQATNLLNGFTNLEELKLSSSMAEVLRSGPPLHRHDKLRCLTLQGSSVEQLLKLLHAMPSLEFLSVNVEYLQEYNYETLETIPSCIASHLEEVVLHLGDAIRHIGNGVHLFKLAKFLFKAATRLKKFTITGDHVDLCERLKNVLSTFYHCSPSLEICSCLPDREPTYMHAKIEIRD